MITIELTEKEATVLGELLEGSLSELRMEISNTHSYEYRGVLHERYDAMEKIAGALHASVK